MKNTPRLLLFALVVGVLLYMLFAIKRESFTGENGSGYNIGLQAPVSGLMAAGVVIVAGLVYMVLKKEK